MKFAPFFHNFQRLPALKRLKEPDKCLSIFCYHNIFHEIIYGKYRKSAYKNGYYTTDSLVFYYTEYLTDALCNDKHKREKHGQNISSLRLKIRCIRVISAKDYGNHNANKHIGKKYFSYPPGTATDNHGLF